MSIQELRVESDVWVSGKNQLVYIQHLYREGSKIMYDIDMSRHSAEKYIAKAIKLCGNHTQYICT